MKFENTLDFSKHADEADSLRKFRERFYFPLMNGKEVTYFTGNSLGLQPKSTQDYVLRELEDWATYGVEGHFHARNPWYNYKEFLKDSVARLLGAKTNEVVVMNSLTVNLHLLLVSFYRPEKKRSKIICEYDAFPSDLYAVQSQAAYHRFNPEDAVIYLKAREGEYCLRTEDILKAIEDAGDSLATVMLGGAGAFWGSLVGATLLWSLFVGVRFLPITPNAVGPVKMISYSVLLILMMLFRPQGIMGKKIHTFARK